MMDYLVFVLLAPITTALLAAVAVLVWQRRRARGGAAILVLCTVSIAWLFCNTMEVLAPTPMQTLRWAQATYLFIPMVPLAWMAFAMQFTGRQHWVTLPRFLLVAVVPLATLFIAQTNGWHGWLWRNFRFVEAGPFLGMQVTHGPWFLVHIVSSYFFTLIGSALIVREYVRGNALYRQQALWVVIGALVPILVNVVYVLRLLPGVEKDFSPVSFGVGAMLVSYGIYRLRLFDLQPVARSRVLDSMAEGVIVLDSQNRIADLNPAARVLLGQRKENPVGRALAELLEPAQARALQRFAEVSEAQSEVVVGQNGRPRYYSLRLSPLYDADGHPQGRLALLHDITARREAEEALRRANRELADRNRELESFARTVAHDLKNPIGNIFSFAELLSGAEEDYSADERREFVSWIQHSAEKAQDIIEALLLLAGVRGATVQPEPVAMAPVVRETLKRLQPMLAERGATIVQPPSWPDAVGYAPWIEEVWVNYVTNALKYGGEPPHVELGWREAAEGQVRYFVRDNGPGLPLEAQARLFTPFTRLHEARAEGHGLGLAIVRSIMEKLEGGFGVQSSGAGSTFYFTLPEATGAVRSEE